MISKPENEHLLSPVELESLADQVAERVAEKLANRSKLVDRFQLADILGVSVPTLDRMLRNPKLPRVQIRRRVQFDPDKVISFLSSELMDSDSDDR